MKFVFRPGLRPGPRWGSSRRFLAPLIGWGGENPLPIPQPPRRLRRLGLVAPVNWGMSPSFRGDGRPCPNLNLSLNPNPNLDPILNLNPNPYCCVWE